jgi:NitT/TauT family transport system substrate-binding protein
MPLRRLLALYLVVCALAMRAGLGAAFAEPKELRIGVQYGLGYLPLYVARDAGLFAKHIAARGLGPISVHIVNFTGGPQIQDGLISGTLDIGAGGITVLLITSDKTRGAGDQEMRGLTALSAVPYELFSVDPKLTSLRDLDAHKNKIGLPAIKVSVPAAFLQMASEQINGIGRQAAWDSMTVSLSQPDGVISLASGGSTVDSYLFAPPFSQQMRTQAHVHRVWSSNELFGSPATALATWTTLRFYRDNPQLVAAFVAAIEEAIARIAADAAEAARIYLHAEPSKLSVAYIEDVLKEPDVRFTLAPHNSMRIAEYLARTGTLKHKPVGWKDYFFPQLHAANGD